MPTVSVIIPTYNRASLLREALQSVIDQTFSDWEAIVVDDGSTDGTATTVYSFDDPRIRYIPQEHAERSAARNRGLAAARGEYITFLDDDDLYLPDTLAVEVEFQQSHPDLDMVVGGMQVTDWHGVVREVVRPWLHQPEPNLRTCITGESCFATCGVNLRHAMLQRLDHWFDTRLSLAEDTDFFLRIALSGCMIAWLPAVVFTYRVIHQDRSLRLILDRNSAHRKVLDLLFAHPDLPSEIRSLRQSVYLRLRLSQACWAFAFRQVTWGQRELLHAAIIEPALLDGACSCFVEETARTALDPWFTEDAATYVAFLCEHLPPQLARLGSLQGEILQAISDRQDCQAAETRCADAVD